MVLPYEPFQKSFAFRIKESFSLLTRIPGAGNPDNILEKVKKEFEAIGDTNK